MPEMTITIKMNEEGQVSVASNGTNPVGVFGLLEMGRQTLQQHFTKPASAIQLAPADAIPPSPFRG